MHFEYIRSAYNIIENEGNILLDISFVYSSYRLHLCILGHYCCSLILLTQKHLLRVILPRSKRNRKQTKKRTPTIKNIIRIPSFINDKEYSQCLRKM